jgi:hypothetical protein
VQVSCLWSITGGRGSTNEICTTCQTYHLAFLEGQGKGGHCLQLSSAVGGLIQVSPLVRWQGGGTGRVCASGRADEQGT